MSRTKSWHRLVVVALLMVGLPLAAAMAAGLAAANEEGLTAAELEKVVGYLVDQIRENGLTAFSGEEIEAALGVSLSDADGPLLQAEVLLKLEEEGLVNDLSQSRCAEYGACSIYGNLSYATDDVLALYEREKAQDGRTYNNLALPLFAARNLADEVVKTTDLRGQPAVLVFLAGHCQHSLDSIPILNRLVDEFSIHGVRVVGVYINSGSVEDINTWLPEQNPQFEVWIEEDPALGDLVENHLVPVYFFLDEAGQIAQKAVGFKDSRELRAFVNGNLDRLEAAAL